MSILFAVIAQYFLIRAKRSINEDFSKLYFISNNYIFFNYKDYTGGWNNIPHAYYMICCLLLVFAFTFGVYSKSFYYKEGFSITLCIAMFTLLFMFYPMFIHALYMRIIVHPRVEKTFNRPLLSCLCGRAQHKALVDELLGPEPMKCPIQYEEVFHGNTKTLLSD
jgi:hypothetical protein